MFRSCCLYLTLSFTVPWSAAAEDPNPSAPVARIIFGSCIKQDQPAPIFSVMATEKAELLLLTGDNIYADTEEMSLMRKKYQSLAANPDFDRLRNTCEVLATWDDHDFGVNDGGASYPKRAESQNEFLDFLNVAADSPRRDQSGVYHAQMFGPDGKRLQVILLDTRYFRSSLKTGDRRVGGPYYPDHDPEKTMLGDPQWQWLREQLRQPADLRLIVSSIQFAASDAGQECWANLPNEQARMLDLLQETRAGGVVFISGDRHWSEISALRANTPYPLYDITCSSLNQLHERGTPTENTFRIDKPTYHRENYGLLSIDWETDDPRLSFQIRSLDATPVISLDLRLSELSH